MYIKCSLYAIKSKSMLKEILNIKNNKWLNKAYVQSQTSPFIDKKNKARLIESPNSELKSIQKLIKNMLSRYQFPNYVFSGVKKKSYVDNANEHKGKTYLYKVDISSFFPNTSRNKVYQFFKNELKTSSDVANILTNFCTFDLSSIIQTNNEIASFLDSKKIIHLNHLSTGACTSPVLSYLVNKQMFNELYETCEQNNIKMTIYIDDISFSSTNPLVKNLRSRIISIITKNGYNISVKKTKYYLPTDVKKVTGVIIKKDGSPDVPNKLRLKIKSKFENLKSDSDKKQLAGYIAAAKQIRKDIYPSISHSIKMKA